MDWRGCVYFWQLCSICKRKRFMGRVPLRYGVARYVSSRLPGLDVAEMEAGLVQVKEAGLVIEEDGHLVIDGWARQQTDPTGAERQARWRAKQKADDETERNALRRYGDSHVTTDLRTEIENREEEEEEPPIPPNGGKASSRSSLAPSADEQHLIDVWKDVHDHPRAKPTTSRLGAIRARMREGYSVDELEKAIRGARSDPALYQEGGKVYDSMETILNPSRLDRCIRYADNPPTTVQKQPQRKLNYAQQITQTEDGRWIDGRGFEVNDPSKPIDW
jgi:hypothetical protein